MDIQLIICGKPEELAEVLAALRPVLEPREISRTQDEQAAQEAARERLLDLCFDEDNFPDWSVRTFNCLVKEGIRTLRQLAACTEGQLRGIRNFGSRSINEVKDVLSRYDLALAEPEP